MTEDIDGNVEQKREERIGERRHGLLYRILSPPVIAAIFAGLTLFTGAVFTGVLGILSEQREQGKLQAEYRKEQAQKIEKVITLVDGTKSALLRKIAVILRVTANNTGKASDIKAAEEAEREADEQEERVKRAIEAEKLKGQIVSSDKEKE